MAKKPTIEIIHICGKAPSEPTQSWWRECKCQMTGPTGYNGSLLMSDALTPIAGR